MRTSEDSSSICHLRPLGFYLLKPKYEIWFELHLPFGQCFKIKKKIKKRLKYCTNMRVNRQKVYIFCFGWNTESCEFQRIVHLSAMSGPLGLSRSRRTFFNLVPTCKLDSKNTRILAKFSFELNLLYEFASKLGADQSVCWYMFSRACYLLKPKYNICFELHPYFGQCVTIKNFEKNIQIMYRR